MTPDPCGCAQDARSHFTGMVLSDEADAGMTFDTVYSSAYADLDTKSHFISPSSMVLEAGCNETGNEDAQRAKLVQQQASASLRLSQPLTAPCALLQPCSPACMEEAHALYTGRRTGSSCMSLVHHGPRTNAHGPRCAGGSRGDAAVDRCSVRAEGYGLRAA